MNRIRTSRGRLAPLLLSLLVVLAVALPALAVPEVRLSSTIGPIDAGIVKAFAEAFEKKTGTKVVFEGAGTGATLEKAKSGNFDMVMVHARRLEDQFVADGFGIDRRDVMYNDFVILGPKEDPAGVRGMKDAAEAFRKIAASGAPFVTRGDNSGTHVKEMEVWEKAGIVPGGDGYVLYEIGKAGNKATTQFANRRGSYVLMDRATVLTMKKDISLEVLVEGDPFLYNYIAVIRVNPETFQGLNVEGALAFTDWLCGDEAQSLVRDFGVEKYGEPLFFPNSDQWKAKNP